MAAVRFIKRVPSSVEILAVGPEKGLRKKEARAFEGLVRRATGLEHDSIAMGRSDGEKKRHQVYMQAHPELVECVRRLVRAEIIRRAKDGNDQAKKWAVRFGINVV